jgi:protein phosphatase
MVKINYFGKTDSGQVRPNNEDVFLIKPDMGLCVVADGMGGAAAGELASRIFAETALEVFLRAEGQPEKEIQRQTQIPMENSDDVTIIRAETEIPKLVQTIFTLANERILDHVKKTPRHQGMGCTAELIAFYDDNFVLGHLGDSRIYRIQNGKLKQLTKDHSLVQDQIDKGLISPEDARNHSLRNIITRAVGIDKMCDFDMLRGTISSGDLFLLCSDGLTDMVDDNLIQKVLSSSMGLSSKAEKLVEMANSAGGRDNITVALSEIL